MYFVTSFKLMLFKYLNAILLGNNIHQIKTTRKENHLRQQYKFKNVHVDYGYLLFIFVLKIILLNCEALQKNIRINVNLPNEEIRINFNLIGR